MSVRYGTYVGHSDHLRNEGAILTWKHPYTKRMRKGRIFAQFNNFLLHRHDSTKRQFTTIGRSLGFGWHEFAEKDFKIKPEMKWSNEHEAREYITQINREFVDGTSSSLQDSG